MHDTRLQASVPFKAQYPAIVEKIAKYGKFGALDRQF
jgi:hypothetical protein